MLASRRKPAGFTLIELLMVLVVVSILAGLAIPSSRPNLVNQLRAAARIMVGDAAYARSLAVANNSKYRLRFDVSANRYILEHSGTNAALAKLPDSPFRSASDPSSQQIIDFDDLLRTGIPVRLLGAVANGSQRVDNLEFGPLGQTTRVETTAIWLSAGSGGETRCMSVSFDPVTGLAEIGPVGMTIPAALTTN